MSRHSKHTKSKGLTKLILLLLIIIFICSTILFIKIKHTENQDNSRQEEISSLLDTIEISSKDVTSETTERMLQVRELRKSNNDIIGWLEIEGTSINYPVLQGEDNEYYLTHDYKKEKITGGSLFLDKDYSFILPSDNLLIYRT